jgi:hypothetical protein
MTPQDPTAKVDIKDGSIKDGAVTFKVTTTTARGEFTWTYKGKIEGDKITGTREADFNGNPISQPWEAAKQKM